MRSMSNWGRACLIADGGKRGGEPGGRTGGAISKALGDHVYDSCM